MNGKERHEMEKDGSLKNFAVVEFSKEVVNGKKIVELVPSKWLVSVGDQWYCYYPPKAEYPQLDHMVRNNLDHKDTWETFKVNPLKFTQTLKRGEKKLKDAYERPLRMDSTDSEMEAENASGISRSQVRSILESSTSLPRLSTIEERDSTTENSQRADHNEASSSFTRKNVTEIPQSMTRAGKKKILATRLLELEEKTDDYDTLLIFEYMATSVDLLSLNIMEKIDNIKRSCRLEVENQTEELKKSVFAASIGQGSGRPVDPRTKFTCSFPIEELDEFLKFEQSLNPKDEMNSENPEIALQRQENLKDIMQLEVGPSKGTCDADIAAILTALIKKNVQVKYSGIGRRTINSCKKDFSATFTFKCLEDFLKVKHQLDSQDSKKIKISSLVGGFLSGANDREGGASERKKQALLRAIVDTSDK